MCHSSTVHEFRETQTRATKHSLECYESYKINVDRASGHSPPNQARRGFRIQKRNDRHPGPRKSSDSPGRGCSRWNLRQPVSGTRSASRLILTTSPYFCRRARSCPCRWTATRVSLPRGRPEMRSVQVSWRGFSRCTTGRRNRSGRLGILYLVEMSNTFLMFLVKSVRSPYTMSLGG